MSMFNEVMLSIDVIAANMLNDIIQEIECLICSVEKSIKGDENY